MVWIFSLIMCFMKDNIKYSIKHIHHINNIIIIHLSLKVCYLSVNTYLQHISKKLFINLTGTIIFFK